MRARSAIGRRDREPVELTDKKLERFVTRSLGSPLKLEVFIHLAFHPSHSYTLEDLQSLTSVPPEDIEAALIALENRGLIFIQRLRGIVRAKLRRIPTVIRLAELLWRYSCRPGGMGSVTRCV